MWRDEAPHEINPHVGEIWCDFRPGVKLTWFKIEAIDAERRLILGHRWPSPPDDGGPARTFIEAHPYLGVADIETFAYFRSWCEL
jgi:hypothetical protein